MTVNNRIQIKTNLGESKITIPLGTTFDETGREDQVRLWEMVEQQDAVNIIRDYETTRYYYGNDGGGANPNHNIHYEFQFTSDGTSWNKDYRLVGFTHPEMFRGKKSFTRSFFKFDFYDTPVRAEQQLMFTMVMPVTNSDKKSVVVDNAEDPQEYFSQKSKCNNCTPQYDVFTPRTRLAPTKGNNEGYYIQWYKNRDLYSGDTFYMGCKFYNSKTGEDVRMVNRKPDINNLGGNTLEPMEWYYYAVKLKYGASSIPKYYYRVHRSNMSTYTNGTLGSERGHGTAGWARIRFYQYFNS